MKNYLSKDYTKEDLDTDLAWFDGLCVSRKLAKEYIFSLLMSKPDDDVKKVMK